MDRVHQPLYLIGIRDQCLIHIHLIANCNIYIKHQTITYLNLLKLYNDNLYDYNYVFINLI